MYSTMGNEPGSIYGHDANKENPYGISPLNPNAPAVGVAPVDPHANVGVGHSIRDEGKTSDEVYNEYVKLKSDLERLYPEVAKNLPMVDPRDPNAVIAARDKAISLRNGEEGKELQQKMGSGIMALVGGAALLSMGEQKGGEQKLAGNGASLLAAGANSNEKDDRTAIEGHKTNARFDELLMGHKKGDPLNYKDVGMENIGVLTYSAKLPNLIAHEKGKEDVLARA